MAHTESEPQATAVLAEQDVTGISADNGLNEMKKDSASPTLNGIPSTPSTKEGGERTSTHPITTDSQTTSAPTRPTLVQLGSNSAQSSSATHTKRLYTSNINKKFLEQNSSNTVASNSSLNAAAAMKPGMQTSRPVTQTSTSHPRLVTTKLTATPPASTTTGPGWSRPSSATPPVVAGNAHSPKGTSPTLSTAPTTLTPQGAPPLPVAGRVIQPQPRSALLQIGAASEKSTSGRPAWGSVKPSSNISVALQDNKGQSDFPTAAEVAQASARKSKPQQPDLKGQNSQAAAPAASNPTSKLVRSEDADTFRGKHLDPHSHHWDEMVQEDDNFLDAPLEFDDGTQYKIKANDAPSQPKDLEQMISKEDRFGDDFDRSWPRAAASPIALEVTLPSASPRMPHSPQEPSPRALFNERSNRLEPYNGPKLGSYPKRGIYESSAPGDKSSRDPLVSPSRSHFQPGNKPGNDLPPRSRRFSNDTSAPSPTDRRQRDREQAHRRDTAVPGSMGPPPLPKDSSGFRVGPGRDRELSSEYRGRGAAKGTPNDRAPLASRESGRQLPPHFSHTPSPGSVSQRLPSQDSRHPSDSISVKTHRQPSQSPAQSVAPLPLPTIPPHLNAPDLEEVRKDVMHSAAERAKQRRQLEEQEREKEKERARQKAAEIEARMKATAPQPSEVDESATTNPQKDEVLEIIEVAVSDAKVTPEDVPESPRPQSSPLSAKAQLPRPPSTRGTSRLAAGDPRSPSRRPSAIVPNHSSPAEEATTWRSRVPRAPAVPTSPQPQNKRTPFAEELPTTDITQQSQEEVEVVDFSELGKVLGEPRVSVDPQSSNVEDRVSRNEPKEHPRRPGRPVASDFSEDEATMDPKPDAWRRQAKTAEGHATREKSDDSVTVPPANMVSKSRESSSTTSERFHAHSSPYPASHGHQHSHHPTPTTHRPARNAYRDVSMSALDDAMSRIKGALNGMQSSEFKASIASTTKPEGEGHSQYKSAVPPHLSKPLQKGRWAPPGHRSQKADPQPAEVFDVTVSGTPSSPEPHNFTVSLPQVAPRDLIHQRQLNLFSKPSPHTWDVLSFDPPVEGMRRDFSLNDILFRKPPGGFKGKTKIRLYLPRAQGSTPHAPRLITPAQPKVSGIGAFGRPSNADVSSWRRPEKKEEPPVPLLGGSLESDSPKSNVLVDDSKSELPTQHNQESAPIRLRSQPRMPAGSSVAFYRDSRIDAAQADPKVTVSFIVSSELDNESITDSIPTEVLVATATNEQPTVTVTPPVSDDKDRPISSESRVLEKPAGNSDQLQSVPATEPPTPVNANAENHDLEQKADDPPVNDTPATSPPTSTVHASPSPQNSWTRSSVSITLKDSPARRPDPEHLKAVWSQTSNKPGLPTVNSLEGIVDDPVPFTIPEVKSEDGETPPPSIPSSGPSRMSIHDVTRAFQQVPPTSNSSNPHSHRTTIPIPPSAPVARPAGYAYPMPSNNMRQSYQPTFSPMMSHSPGPVMYQMSPAPVPSRMAATTPSPMYNQPVWVPVNAAGRPSPNPSMMRPVPSPYPAPMMAYPAPPGTQAMYGHPAANTRSPSHQHAHQHNPTATPNHRGRNHAMPPMISPVISPATAAPMYAGSPVLVQTYPANHGYLPMQSARGQSRSEGSHMSLHPHTPQAIHPPHHVYSNPRPTW